MRLSDRDSIDHDLCIKDGAWLSALRPLRRALCLYYCQYCHLREAGAEVFSR